MDDGVTRFFLLPTDRNITANVRLVTAASHHSHAIHPVITLGDTLHLVTTIPHKSHHVIAIPHNSHLTPGDSKITAYYLLTEISY